VARTLPYLGGLFSFQFAVTKAPAEDGIRSGPGRRRVGALAFAALACLMTAAVGACTSFPQPASQAFPAHAVVKERHGMVVSAAVLTDAEATEYFGCPLAQHGVQAVWLRVQNNNRYPIIALPRDMDPDYFSPLEVSYLCHHAFDSQANQRLDDFFLDTRFPAMVAREASGTGFVFTRLQEGAKFVNVAFWHGMGLTRDGFFLRLPNGGFDFQQADFGKIYPPAQKRALTPATLHALLTKLPCCTSNRIGTRTGDPVNFAMVGAEDDVLGALVQQGWDPTHTIGRQSAARTVSSFLFGGRYRYSPVSTLYYFGRGQDLAMQRVRETVHQRNHLRLWRSPYTYRGREVWLGQISRDIGVRFTWASPILLTHKIDPEVDEAREYLVQDMIASGWLAAIGYVQGVGAASRQHPRHNLTGDPYFTDGLRAVMFISDKPVAADAISAVNWDHPFPGD